MALVNCSECNKEISDKARSCPHCGVARKQKRKATKVLAGVVVALLAIGIIGQCAEDPKEQSEAAQAQPPAEKAEASVSAPVTRLTIGRSTSDVLGSIAAIERTSSPLRDGTAREHIALGKNLHLETIGKKTDLLRYSIMFAIEKNDKASAIETAVLISTVLANTFPDWGKQGGNDTVPNWVGNATKQLGANMKRNKDKPDPVIMERDGLRIRYSATPSLGLFFVTVEPQTDL